MENPEDPPKDSFKENPKEKPPIETDIRFWSVVFVIWISLLLGFMNISTKIDLLVGIFSKE